MKAFEGIHHVTAITSSAEKIYDFYTNILGIRLVKKTINQDDIQTYHLFFADESGSPGTDMTFFDFPNIPKGTKGTDEISRTSFRVPNDAALDYWVKRFAKYAVKHGEIKELFGVKTLQFEDFDEQQYQLISDETDTGVASGKPWHKGPVPDEFAITGLGPIFFRVSNFDYMKEVLEKVLFFKELAVEGQYHQFEVGEFGGNGAQIIVESNTILPRGRQGYGSVHHVAFRSKDRKNLDSWTERMQSFGLPNSGYVDRFYFESTYTNIYPGILFELATDEPGFIDDEESIDHLGETLALPPAFRNDRARIESLVRPIDTVRSTKVFEKEYLA
ncbi:ring-cleaving dioxygenase [Carnobacterium jeotgali]|uniref:ring-cleaving dioxygenase n=1 Tax=Carnobacterium jeotgali TaxID=545534 RepID=UPI003890C8A8